MGTSDSKHAKGAMESTVEYRNWASETGLPPD